MNKDLARLRRSFDSDEGFMSSHQIKDTRRGRRTVPAEWTASDAEVRKVLLRAYPALRTRQAGATRAGRWLRVIHLYYRVGWTASRIAEDMDTTTKTIEMIIYRIHRAFNGLRGRDGKPRSGKRGRPKKK